MEYSVKQEHYVKIDLTNTDFYTEAKFFEHDGGVITLDFRLVDGEARSQWLVGQQEFDNVIKYFNNRARIISAAWDPGGVNFTAFVNAVMNENKSFTQAAFSTWTGQQAFRHGFTKIKSIQVDGGKRIVRKDLVDKKQLENCTGIFIDYYRP